MSVIRVGAREATLRKRVRSHLRAIGFSRAPDGSLSAPNLDKDSYRAIHSFQRSEKIERHLEWIKQKAEKFSKYFADGSDIVPSKIRPRLELAPGDTWQADLFRLAGLSWKIPISEGYGRRMRFLVWDDWNGKLIGLLALGDAVFNLRARDEFIGWDHNRRGAALVHLMDA